MVRIEEEIFFKKIKILSDNKSQEGANKRKEIFDRIRNPNLIEPDTPDEEKMAEAQASRYFMPPMSGDGGSVLVDDNDQPW